MTKQELMENYTAEQLAEMIVETENVSKLRITKCEVSENKELLKGKCDKCGEEFILSLDNKYILCTKAGLYATREANRQLNKDVSELQSEVEKYRKAFENAKKERDCQIAEYQKKIEELENHHKFSMMQIDDVLVEFFDVTHEIMEKPHDFEKVLQEVIDKSKTISDFLPTEPIKVVDILINAHKRDLYEDSAYYSKIYRISELRQIAEHLLVYCNHNGEAEE